MVVEYGFGYSGTREIALNNDKKYHSEFFCGVVLARFILMLIAAIILIILCFFYVFNDVKSLLCVGFLSVIAGVFNPNWFLQGKEMMSVMAVLSLFSEHSSRCSLSNYKTRNADVHQCLIIEHAIYFVFILWRCLLTYYQGDFFM